MSSEKKLIDYGFSKFENEFFFFDTIDDDNEITKKTNEYYSLYILSDTRYKYYTREYMKFQDVLARLGSFMNLLILITHSVYAFYYRFRLRNYFFRKLIRIPCNYQSEIKKVKIIDIPKNIKIELNVSESTDRKLKFNNNSDLINKKFIC